MDLFFIQYWKVIVGASDDDAWRMPVPDSNACSGVRLLGMVGQTLSAIVSAVAFRSEESGKECAESRRHLIFTHRIREITYRGWFNWCFYNSEESFYFLQLLGADDIFGSGRRTDAGVSIHWIDSRQKGTQMSALDSENNLLWFWRHIYLDKIGISRLTYFFFG